MGGRGLSFGGWEVLPCEICVFFSRLLMGLEGRDGVEVCCGWITWKFELRTLVRWTSLFGKLSIDFSLRIVRNSADYDEMLISFLPASCSPDFLSKCMSSYASMCYLWES